MLHVPAEVGAGKILLIVSMPQATTRNADIA